MRKSKICKSRFSRPKTSISEAPAPAAKYPDWMTPAQRRIQAAINAEHDAHRRRTNTMFLFWSVCSDKSCRRAKSCNGDPHACFARWWPHVPDDFKISLRAQIRALSGQAPLGNAARPLTDDTSDHQEQDVYDTQQDGAEAARAAAGMTATADVSRHEARPARARHL